jgi:hypothetical protein
MAKKLHPIESALVIFDQNIEAALKSVRDTYGDLDQVPPIKGQPTKPKEPPYNPMNPGSF